MGFTIPNDVPGGTTEQHAQATPDTVDIDILVAGNNLTGVQSGCAVTAQGSPNMTLAVAGGTVGVAGVAATVTVGNVTITAADATNPRFDLVVVNSAGTKSVTAGTPAALPVFPAVPANSAVLAAVYVGAGVTAIATADIVDKRVIVTQRARVLDEIHADAGSANSSAEQTLATLVLPAGVVAVGDTVRFVALGDFLNNSGSAVTYTWRWKLGGTTLLTTAALSYPTGSNRGKWRFSVDVEFPTTASERVSGLLMAGSSSASTMTAVTASLSAVGYGTAAEDTANALNVVLTCQLGTAALTADVIIHAAYLELVKK